MTRFDVADIAALEDSSGEPIVDEDGLPRMLYMFLWKSKGEVGPVEFQLLRNYRDLSLCPVYWLLVYMRLARLESGPLFPKLATNGVSTGERMAVDNVSHEFGEVNVASFFLAESCLISVIFMAGYQGVFRGR